MAATTISAAFPTGTKMWQETAIGATQVTLVAAAAVLYEVEIDNSANAATVEYLKLYDTTGAIVVGTTAPTMTLKIAAGVSRSYVFPLGIAFANGISAVCVSDGGGTAGATAPASSVIARAVYTT